MAQRPREALGSAKEFQALGLLHTLDYVQERPNRFEHTSLSAHGTVMGNVHNKLDKGTRLHHHK
eukprot:3553865-Pyramimonas_sp.AAC.1